MDKATLQSNARVRLEDAQVLYDHGRYDGAAYLCGYAVEFALKARICEILNTSTYPDHISGFKIHKLETLLFLTGRKDYLKQNAFSEWTFVVQNWEPEMRYKASGNISPVDVRTLIEATKALLLIL